MPKRTEHGHRRHEQGDRPTKEAFRDRESPEEIYLDLDTDNRIYVGAKGRTHIFTPDGTHHTSYRTTKDERLRKIRVGQWIHLNRSGEE